MATTAFILERSTGMLEEDTHLNKGDDRHYKDADEVHGDLPNLRKVLKPLTGTSHHCTKMRTRAAIHRTISNFCNLVFRAVSRKAQT